MNEMSLYQAQEMVSAPRSTNSMISTREAQEVQAAVFMAKQFPGMRMNPLPGFFVPVTGWGLP